MGGDLREDRAGRDPVSGWVQLTNDISRGPRSCAPEQATYVATLGSISNTCPPGGLVASSNPVTPQPRAICLVASGTTTTNTNCPCPATSGARFSTAPRGAEKRGKIAEHSTTWVGSKLRRLWVNRATCWLLGARPAGRLRAPRLTAGFDLSCRCEVVRSSWLCT